MKKLINNIVRLWFKIPRYTLKIKIQKVYVDKRSYEWYLDRKEHGFDERVLWNLSGYLDDRIRKTLELPPSETESVSLQDFRYWIRSSKSKEDLRWFADRVTKYVDWDCYYTIFVSEGKGGYFIEGEEKKKLLQKYKGLIRGAAYIGHEVLNDEEINFLFGRNRFGW